MLYLTDYSVLLNKNERNTKEGWKIFRFNNHKELFESLCQFPINKIYSIASLQLPCNVIENFILSKLIVYDTLRTDQVTGTDTSLSHSKENFLLN